MTQKDNGLLLYKKAKRLGLFRRLGEEEETKILLRLFMDTSRSKDPRAVPDLRKSPFFEKSLKDFAQRMLTKEINTSWRAQALLNVVPRNPDTDTYTKDFVARLSPEDKLSLFIKGKYLEFLNLPHVRLALTRGLERKGDPAGKTEVLKQSLKVLDRVKMRSSLISLYESQKIRSYLQNEVMSDLQNMERFASRDLFWRDQFLMSLSPGLSQMMGFIKRPQHFGDATSTFNRYAFREALIKVLLKREQSFNITELFLMRISQPNKDADPLLTYVFRRIQDANLLYACQLCPHWNWTRSFAFILCTEALYKAGFIGDFINPETPMGQRKMRMELLDRLNPDKYSDEELLNNKNLLKEIKEAGYTPYFIKLCERGLIERTLPRRYTVDTAIYLARNHAIQSFKEVPALQPRDYLRMEMELILDGIYLDDFENCYYRSSLPPDKPYSLSVFSVLGLKEVQEQVANDAVLLSRLSHHFQCLNKLALQKDCLKMRAQIARLAQTLPQEVISLKEYVERVSQGETFKAYETEILINKEGLISLFEYVEKLLWEKVPNPEAQLLRFAREFYSSIKNCVTGKAQYPLNLATRLYCPWFRDLGFASFSIINNFIQVLQDTKAGAYWPRNVYKTTADKSKAIFPTLDGLPGICEACLDSLEVFEILGLRFLGQSPKALAEEIIAEINFDYHLESYVQDRDFCHSLKDDLGVFTQKLYDFDNPRFTGTKANFSLVKNPKKLGYQERLLALWYSPKREVLKGDKSKKVRRLSEKLLLGDDASIRKVFESITIEDFPFAVLNGSDQQINKLLEYCDQTCLRYCGEERTETYQNLPWLEAFLRFERRRRRKIQKMKVKPRGFRKMRRI